MRTIILAGGWGSRLGNLSEHIPKPIKIIPFLMLNEAQLLRTGILSNLPYS